MITPRREGAEEGSMKRPPDLLIAVAVLALLVIGLAIKRWEYKECRAVGHSVFYCVLSK